MELNILTHFSAVFYICILYSTDLQQHFHTTEQWLSHHVLYKFVQLFSVFLAFLIYLLYATIVKI